MPVSIVSDTRRCLVIGSAGFLGSSLVRLALAERNQKGEPLYSEVIALDRVAPAGIDPEIPTGDRARLITRVGDITKVSEIDSCFQDVDTVFHLASVVYVGLQRRAVLQEVNVEGARNVCELCVKHKVKRLVYTSSTDTVLDTIPRSGANEETAAYPKHPMNDYVRTKVEGEKIVLSYNGKNGLLTCSLRPTHLYGPRNPHAIKHSISMFKQGKVPILLGDGSALFGVIYVDNIAYAHILADNNLAQKGASSPVAGNFYFIGEDNNINYFDFLRPYAKQKGVQLPKVRLPFWLIMIIATIMELLYWLASTLKINWEPAFHRFHCYVIAQDFYFSCAKAHRDFGYKPLVSKEEALQRTLAWFDKEEV